MRPPKVDLVRYHGPVTAEVHEQVQDLFTYHKPTEEKVAAMENVRRTLAQSYEVLLERVPACPTRTRALNMLTDARMLANAAIVHDGNY